MHEAKAKFGNVGELYEVSNSAATVHTTALAALRHIRENFQSMIDFYEVLRDFDVSGVKLMPTLYHRPGLKMRISANSVMCGGFRRYGSYSSSACSDSEVVGYVSGQAKQRCPLMQAWAE